MSYYDTAVRGCDGTTGLQTKMQTQDTVAPRPVDELFSRLAYSILVK